MKLSLFIVILNIITIPSKASDVHAIHQCRKNIMIYETGMGIPKGLLSAIARLESGRKTSIYKDTVPWPWVINANGQGQFFDSKDEAVGAVKKLVRGGMRNIDIGCMQINYHHHGHKFASIASMFEPQHNVEYGAKFLKALRQEHGSWTQAVGRYHSANLKFQVPYKKKLYEIWQVERFKNPLNSLLNDNRPTVTAPLKQGKWDYGGKDPLHFFARSQQTDATRQNAAVRNGRTQSSSKLIVINNKPIKGAPKPTAKIDEPVFFHPELND